MSIESIQAELNYRTKVRISNTVNIGMQGFRALLAEIDCMSDDELEAFQNTLIDIGLHAVTNRHKAFAAAVHDATIHFLEHNRKD